MVISHKYHYLFIETPHTGTTAIAKELKELYGGIPLLSKHASYFDFMRIARGEERDYTVFSGVRNPLDEAVSIFSKYANNHKGNYTNPKRLKKNGGWVTEKDCRKFRFIQKNDSSFGEYLLKFYKLPYTTNMHVVNQRHIKNIYRFENLEKDFTRILEAIGIKKMRELPRINITQNKNIYLSYYGKNVRFHASNVFGPFMKDWGYKYPPEWHERPGLKYVLAYNMLKIFRFYYAKFT